MCVCVYVYVCMSVYECVCVYVCMSVYEYVGRKGTVESLCASALGGPDVGTF